VTDESQLQITRNRDSSLSLSKPRSSLIARGCREAATLAAASILDPLLETRRLAEAGDANAQFELGEAYHKGQGVPQDFAEAISWYRKAAEQYHLCAMENLGEMFENGQGVRADRAETFRWYCRAADVAYSDLSSKPAQWDPDVTIGVFHKAAEYGYALAQWIVGALLAVGVFHRPPDYVQAYMWINLAASASTGDDQREYLSERDAVAAKMTPQKVAEAQRLAREWKPKNASSETSQVASGRDPTSPKSPSAATSPPARSGGR